MKNELELLASGMTHAEILADYEDLEEEDLQACLLFAANALKIKHIVPLAAWNGNISNDDLLQLFRNNLLAIEAELSQADVVEMTRKSLVVLQWFEMVIGENLTTF